MPSPRIASATAPPCPDPAWSSGSARHRAASPRCRGGAWPRPSRSRCSRRPPPRPASVTPRRRRGAGRCRPRASGRRTHRPRRCPGSSGRDGVAPVAITSWSYGSVVSAFEPGAASRSRTVTVCAVGVDRDHLVARAHVDPEPAVLLGRPRDQRVGVMHEITDEVRECRTRRTTCARPSRTRRSRAPRPGAAGAPGRRAHPRRVTPDDQQPLRHVERIAVEAVQRDLGLGDDRAHEVAGRHQLVDRSDPLAGRVALAVRVDPGRLLVGAEVHPATLHPGDQLLGELLELLGVLARSTGWCRCATARSVLPVNARLIVVPSSGGARAARPCSRARSAPRGSR